jgi:hypothetical protein
MEKGERRMGLRILVHFNKPLIRRSADPPIRRSADPPIRRSALRPTTPAD